MGLDTRECALLGCGDERCEPVCAGVEKENSMTQMKVEPDYPVPDDKLRSSGLDYFLIPENPISKPKAEFSVEPVAGGKMYSFKNEVGVKTVKYHRQCDLPYFQHNSLYQYFREYREDCKRIPDGCLWQCDECGAVYEARSRWTIDRSGMKRRWSKMRWYSFLIRNRWNQLQGVS